MRGYATGGDRGPWVFVQWKGTDACLDKGDVIRVRDLAGADETPVGQELGAEFVLGRVLAVLPCDKGAAGDTPPSAHQQRAGGTNNGGT